MEKRGALSYFFPLPPFLLPHPLVEKAVINALASGGREGGRGIAAQLRPPPPVPLNVPLLFLFSPSLFAHQKVGKRGERGREVVYNFYLCGRQERVGGEKKEGSERPSFPHPILAHALRNGKDRKEVSGCLSPSFLPSSARNPRRGNGKTTAPPLSPPPPIPTAFVFFRGNVFFRAPENNCRRRRFPSPLSWKKRKRSLFTHRGILLFCSALFPLCVSKVVFVVTGARRHQTHRWRR